MFVQALREEGGLVALGHHILIGVLRLPIFPRGEQQLAAAELHFVHLRRPWITAQHFIERGQRLLGLARGFVGARELVEHLVVARIVGIALEQAGVQLDGFRALQVDGGRFARHALALARLHVEVAQATQCFGAQLRIGLLQFKEAPVVVHGARGARFHFLIGLNHDRTRGQLADGLFLFLAAAWRPTRSRRTSRPGTPGIFRWPLHFGASAGGVVVAGGASRRRSRRRFSRRCLPEPAPGRPGIRWRLPPARSLRRRPAPRDRRWMQARNAPGSGTC